MVNTYNLMAQRYSFCPALAIAFPFGLWFAPGCKNMSDKLFKVKRALSVKCSEAKCVGVHRLANCVSSSIKD
jgi:hypothetical protein